MPAMVSRASALNSWLPGSGALKTKLAWPACVEPNSTWPEGVDAVRKRTLPNKQPGASHPKRVEPAPATFSRRSVMLKLDAFRVPSRMSKD